MSLAPSSPSFRSRFKSLPDCSIEEISESPLQHTPHECRGSESPGASLGSRRGLLLEIICPGEDTFRSELSEPLQQSSQKRPCRWSLFDASLASCFLFVNSRPKQFTGLCVADIFLPLYNLSSAYSNVFSPKFKERNEAAIQLYVAKKSGLVNPRTKLEKQFQVLFSLTPPVLRHSRTLGLIRSS